MIGTVLAERYRIEAELGAGGVGTVYRATDLERGSRVAVKVLRPELLASAEIRQRFEREARALIALSHSNIVTVLDSGVSGGAPYLVMDLLEGETLADRLLRGPMVLDEAIVTVTQILSALSYVHEHELVHRDVKPANILLEAGPDGATHVRLLDFGLAKFLAPPPTDKTLTRAGQIFGTPAYMAPEQIAGHGVDQRADVYAAGIVFFEMLAGRPPFQGDSSEIMRQQIMEELPFEACLPEGSTPREVLAVVRQATAKTRAERFQTAAEMLTAVERALARPDVALAPATQVVELAQATADPGSAPRGVARLLVGFGTLLAIVVSLGATGVAAFGVYVLVTPARLSERHALEAALGIPSASAPRPAPPGVARSPARGAVQVRAAAGASAPGSVPSSSPAPSSAPSSAPPGPEGALLPAATVVPPKPPAPRGPVTDPWSTTPPELGHLAAKAGRPRGLDKREVLLLHQYNAKHPDDPRGHLLLGRSYVGRKWFKDAVNEYSIALKVSDQSRGDPRAIRDLLTLVGFGSAEAARLVAEAFGETAAPAIDRALAGPLPNPEAKVLLRRLRTDVQLAPPAGVE
jgi:serine/threonine-protein kinase